MDRELMDKPVLCMFDTRQIQQFMFHANSFLDNIGGSDRMINVLGDAIEYALIHNDTPLSEDEYDLSLDPDAESKFFTSEHVKFQYVYMAAGNALCLFRTGELCRNVIHKVSRYYLDHGYSLNVAAAAVLKTDNLGHDTFEIYKKLAAVKASCEVSNPLGPLPIVMKENRTGEPVVAFDEKNGDYVSKKSQIRRKFAYLREHYVDYDEIRTTTDWNGKKYRAMIHADGNNLGISIGRILQMSKNYEEGIRIRRMINYNIDLTLRRVVGNSVQEVMDGYLKNGGSKEQFDYEFFIMHRAGDDVNICCNANLAFPFIEAFYRHLEGAMLWDGPTLKLPLFACTGIAFVTPENNALNAFSLAEECCSSAKVVAKKEENLVDGFAGNWIDFQLCDNPNNQKLDLLREQMYITEENINLLLRPYCMDPEHRVSFRDFMNRVKNYNELSLDDYQKQMMHTSYGVGKLLFNGWVKTEESLDLVEKLGKPLLTQKGEQARSVWFDAADVSEFVRKDEAM